MRGLTQLQGRPKATATVAYMIGCWLYVSDKGGDKEEMECATRHQYAIRKDQGVRIGKQQRQRREMGRRRKRRDPSGSHALGNINSSLPW